MSIKKPQSAAEISPPFQHIGEPEWEVRLRRMLRDYRVPEPVPVSEDELSSREAALGARFPISLRDFLRTIGPLDFRAMRVLPLDEIRPLVDVWFAPVLPPQVQVHLPDLFAVMDYYGTGDFVAWDRTSGRFVLVRHDPLGVRDWFATFDECIREQCIHLAMGFFGWPDDDVAELVEIAKQNLQRPDTP